MTDKRRSIAQWAALVVLGLVIYLPAFNAPFTFDDHQAIVQNHYIRATSLSPQSLFRAAFQDYRQNRPLTNLSFALNYYFSQMDPFGYHLANFLVFILTAAGIRLLAKKLLLRLGLEESRAGLASWLAALAWVAFPLNVQAVTYTVQRATCMAGAFSIWSVYFFHLGMERKEKAGRDFLLSGLCCLSALLSKETALALPALLLAYKIYFFDRLAPGILSRNRKWLLGLSLFYLAALMFALRPAMSAVVFDFGRMPFTAWQRSLTEPMVLAYYAMLIVFPLPQRLSIEHHFFASRSWLEPRYTAIFLVLLLTAVILTFFRSRKNPALGFAALWYFGQLIVEALPLPIDLAAEQRLYLASLSFIVPALTRLLARPAKPRPAIFLIGLAILFYGGFTFQRNRAWNDPEMLWRDAVKKSPLFARPANNYCSVLADQGKCEQAFKACGLAIAFSRSLPDPYMNLGVCYSKRGREDLAEEVFRKAADLSGGSAWSLFHIGMTFYIRRDYASAVTWFAEAAAKDPSNPEPHFYLAQSFRVFGRTEDWMRELAAAVKLRPEWAEARGQLAWALVAAGRCPEAAALVKSAPALDPQFANVTEYCRSK